jgi:hypothetical protein
MNRYLQTILLVLTLILLSNQMLWAKEPVLDEYAFKSAFLYNFAKFVTWPLESFPADRPFLNICLIGDAPFGSSLEAISSKTIYEKQLTVQRIDNIEAISSCHVLFISKSEANRLKPILESARSHHVLTVSDIERFDLSGGMIHLFTASDKIRFSINQDAAKLAGLEISSQLLKLSVTNNK